MDRARATGLRGLGRHMAQRAVAAVERLAATEQGDVTRLQGVEPPEWRLRVVVLDERVHGGPPYAWLLTLPS
jgi:hypothetical protein